AEVRKRQRKRLSDEEFKTLAELRAEARTGRLQMTPPADALRHAQEHVFERVSVARDHEILSEALRYGRGQLNHQELKGSLAAEESSGKLLRHGKEIATVETLQREREMVEIVNRGVGACERLAATHFDPSDRLSPEQRRVIEF